MKNRIRYPSARAFSMIELVVALGICAISLVALTGLLARAARETGTVSEAATVQRVFAGVRAEVAISGASAVIEALVDGAEPATDANALFANRSANEIGSASQLPADERFFAIVFERDVDLSPAAADTDAGFIAFQVRIEWPYRLPDGTPVDARYRNIRRFPAARAR